MLRRFSIETNSLFQLVEAPSLSEGLRQLQFDNKTESVNTINILHRWDFLQSSFTHLSILTELSVHSNSHQKKSNFLALYLLHKSETFVHRFNVHQEVVLAGLYNLYSFRLSPIFFYTYAVFALQVFVPSVINVSTVFIKTRF